MAQLVDLKFGGRKECDWSQVETILALYKQIATDNTLILSRNGIDFVFAPPDVDGVSALEAINFWYEKNGMPAAQQQAFADQWAGLSSLHTFTRHDTSTTYYEG